MAGQKCPNPRYETVTVRFSEKEKKKLETTAKHFKKSVAAVVRDAVLGWYAECEARV